MDQRREFIRENRRGLFTMQELCARYAISRKTGYKLVARVEEERREDAQDQATESAHTCATNVAFDRAMGYICVYAASDSDSSLAQCARSWCLPLEARCPVGASPGDCTRALRFERPDQGRHKRKAAARGVLPPRLTRLPSHGAHRAWARIGVEGSRGVSLRKRRGFIDPFVARAAGLRIDPAFLLPL